MIKTKTQTFLLKLGLIFLYLNYTNGCVSNKKLYTEIGCKPIYSNDSNSCPAAYDCDQVFARPINKCYLNGNVYEPVDSLSKTDSALNPCFAACFCDQRTYDNKTTTKFTCAKVECPSYFTRLRDPCYYQYDKDSCCEIKKYCPEEKAIGHECVHDNQVYKNGQRFYVGDYLQCVCSPEFNGTISDKSCREVGCSYEILYMENILSRSAPVYFEKVDGCPIEWFNPEYNAATADEITSTSKSNGYNCKYGDLSISVGQNMTIGQQSDSDTYKTTCSCNTPPLVTCIKVRK
ncbi:uncharacterized protein LOC132941903 [Metopolophium dirhodum]|uniref:uncharacterized protein LOC132941903 n=1 Tax=Metopolophium dirhodum TaxID=44670 RepID=UPI00298F95F8|nr:uncharacterized protein LOC132941903 [Metopolophium dirhodum]